MSIVNFKPIRKKWNKERTTNKIQTIQYLTQPPNKNRIRKRKYVLVIPQ